MLHRYYYRVSFIIHCTPNNAIFWISRLSAPIYLAWSIKTISSTPSLCSPESGKPSPYDFARRISVLYGSDWITSPNPIVADSWRPSTGSWAPAIRPIYRHGRPRCRSAPSVRRTFNRICSWCTRASRSTVSRISSPIRSSPPSGWA